MTVTIWHRLGTNINTMGSDYVFTPCPEDPTVYTGEVPIEVSDFLESLGSSSRYKETYIPPTDLPEDFGSGLEEETSEEDVPDPEVVTETEDAPKPKRRGRKPKDEVPAEVTE